MQTIDEALRNWNLTPDGALMTTHTGLLLPVRRAGEPAMLKIASEDEERRGAAALVWWEGQGAARVLAHRGDALLMERATGPATLAGMVAAGRDDDASRIICDVAALLHAPRPHPTPATLVPLTRWFAALEPAARRHGGLLAQAAEEAGSLLADQREIVVLHGDLHHGNILDFGARGWLAIDPKGLLGERTFDFVNILRNPDDTVALSPDRFQRQVTVLAAAAHLERARFLQWTLAFAGLSAAWILEDGDEPVADLAIARLASATMI
jgi:streptomycin 6-kinase